MGAATRNKRLLIRRLRGTTQIPINKNMQGRQSTEEKGANYEITKLNRISTLRFRTSAL